MIDKEKVIKGMEQFRSDLKPFCGNKADWERFDAGLAMLKEQEAKKVLQIRNVTYRTIGYCPSCGRGLDSYEDGNSGDHITNYCYNCGQAVKWE